MRCVHYVGFRDDRFLAAYRAFGGPVIIHRVWDKRARREIDPEADLVVFANGPHDQAPRARNGDDLVEA
ncbi:hypothetical protein [Stappia indica]|uniref:hypothetical protein n=1 Tax=Stappia indica TaxID=538381 RepID=UPI001CD4EB25|nr:hypothetical protein [Stappia indica]MCA1298027.1 hypothetical protein [Stappia indica]